MKRYLFISTLFITLNLVGQDDSLFIRQIYDEALERGNAYNNLKSLCKDIGARITGSAEAEMAIRWAEKLLNSEGFDTVYLQEITVPHWERGTKEAAWIEDENGNIHKLNVVALGGSIGTNGLISADIIEFSNVEELKKAIPNEIKDKVVFLSQPFNQKHIRTFEAYGACYPLRAKGAHEAGKLGAKALIIRSLSSTTDSYPHTGITHYENIEKRIPAAAISTLDADLLKNWLTKGKVLLNIEMDCRKFADTTSYNVIAEINGKDDKVITWGGHLDSWDLGEGAHDDGAGTVHSIEALSILKKLGYQPNHRLRCVLFMNEENGNFGGKGYAKWVKAIGEEHICAIESDRGGFLPVGFDFKGSNEHAQMISKFKEILYDFQLYKFEKGFTGVDIAPLMKEYPNMLQLGLAISSQRYFDYHHAASDVFENVNKRELELGAAAIASMVYLVDKTLK